ncbi:carbamoyltransferase C-terminal domain-containing protein [Paenibacillus sp. L3-i20]|uniref:carbamoyltransferase C-terminal domain-containing protein n=1 Tax=Paenibacillus sp. L3-i20 TaxID=2905833 RepID=UPI001EE0C9CC|nr:carbamoyltransferase C-terminal domain-containing protein [Paenibacillus sp. L3-i20]GKU80240.1 hypothetical protein L3i20_v246370 [Paenibacillus sp. L3-i20]
MRDGYYLSVYITIDEYRHIFNIKNRHDYNISLYLKENDDVTLVHFWELERITGFKQHDSAFLNTEHAVEFINQLLAVYQLTVDDMVEIWGSPRISTVDDYHPVPEQPDYAYHGIWHLFSGIMLHSNTFKHEQILAFAVDGGPEFNTDPDSEEYAKYYYPGCYVDKGKITYLPAYSPGPLWGYASKKYDMREGSLMALGSAIDIKHEKNYMNDSLFLLKTDTRSYQTYIQLSSLFNEIEADFDKQPPSAIHPDFTYEENKIAFVMHAIQHISKAIMEKNVENAIRELGIDTEKTHLSLTGGFALNCPTNSHLMNKYKFKSFIAPPCVNDSGMSLGIALYAFYKKVGQFNFNFENAYYGDNDHTLHELMSDYQSFVKREDSFHPEQFLIDIQQGPICWFNNRSEVGPRALGNRSLLADPRNPEAKHKLNIIKEREWWRPVAPLVMEEHQKEWFVEDLPSPYMLQTSTIKEDQAAKVPAILHLDRSSRIQTVNERDNKDLYELLHIFNNETGVPILCNTSLNDKGEPIINKLEEAINFALRKKISVVYFNKKRIELHHFEEYHKQSPEPRLRDQFMRENRYTKLLHNRFNPHNLNKIYFGFAYYYPEIVPLLEQGLTSEVKSLLQKKFSEMDLNYEVMLPNCEGL